MFHQLSWQCTGNMSHWQISPRCQNILPEELMRAWRYHQSWHGVCRLWTTKHASHRCAQPEKKRLGFISKHEQIVQNSWSGGMCGPKNIKDCESIRLIRVFFCLALKQRGINKQKVGEEIKEFRPKYFPLFKLDAFFRQKEFTVENQIHTSSVHRFPGLIEKPMLTASTTRRIAVGRRADVTFTVLLSISWMTVEPTIKPRTETASTST